MKKDEHDSLESYNYKKQAIGLSVEKHSVLTKKLGTPDILFIFKPKMPIFFFKSVIMCSDLLVKNKS